MSGRGPTGAAARLALALDLYERGGRSLRDASRRAGAPWEALRRALRERGTMRPPGGRPDAWPEELVAEARRILEAGGSYGQVARLAGCSAPHARHRCVELGLRSGRRSAHPAGRSAAHERHPEILRQARAWAAAGWTAARAAEAWGVCDHTARARAYAAGVRFTKAAARRGHAATEALWDRVERMLRDGATPAEAAEACGTTRAEALMVRHRRGVPACSPKQASRLYHGEGRDLEEIARMCSTNVCEVERALAAAGRPAPPEPDAGELEAFLARHGAAELRKARTRPDWCSPQRWRMELGRRAMSPDARDAAPRAEWMR